jgi:hypothetical protein|tara:strand:- start:442 stop:885 length:444 start_codon:yes stop_codon:yes gene_type:complete
MKSKRASKKAQAQGASLKEIAKQAKKTFGSVGKAAKKINETAANKITVPLARKLMNKTKGAVSNLETKLNTIEVVEMKNGGGMKSKGNKMGGKMRSKGGAMRKMSNGGMMKMKTKGMKKGGKMMSKGGAKGGIKKPSSKNSGLFGKK